MGIYKGTQALSLNGANGANGLNGSGGGSAAVYDYNIILNAEQDSTGPHGVGPDTGHSVSGKGNAVGGTTCSVYGEANLVYGKNNNCAGQEANSCFGYGNTITSTNSGIHCEGYNNSVTGAQGAHVEGYANEITNIGQGSHVEGYSNICVGGTTQGTHVEGKDNIFQSYNGMHIEGMNHGDKTYGSEHPFTTSYQAIHLEGKGHRDCLLQTDGGHQGGVGLTSSSSKPAASNNASGSNHALIEAIGGYDDSGVYPSPGKAIRTMDNSGNMGITGDLVFVYNGAYYSLAEILKQVLASGVNIQPISTV